MPWLSEPTSESANVYARVVVGALPVVLEIAGRSDQLHRRCRVASPGREERAGLADVGGEQPPATDEVVEHLPGRLRVVKGPPRRRLEVHRVERVIHQVRADVRIVDDRGDLVLGQMVGRPNARKH